MDNFRLFNDCFQRQNRTAQRRRPQTIGKKHSATTASIDFSTLMFPECFSVKRLPAPKLQLNRTVTAYSSNATKRMFRRLASRANTAQPHSRKSRQATNFNRYQEPNDDFNQLPEQPSNTMLAPLMRSLMALPESLVATIAANGILFQTDDKPRIYISRSCSSVVRQCFSKRPWWTIVDSAKALSSVNLFWGLRRTTKIRFSEAEGRATALSLARRRLLLDTFHHDSRLLLPYNAENGCETIASTPESGIESILCQLTVCDTEPRMQNHLFDSSILLNFKLLLETLSTNQCEHLPFSQFALYDTSESPQSFVELLLSLNCRKLLVRYCGVHQQFERSAIVSKCHRTLLDMLKRVRKHQPLIFQPLPDPLIRDIYSFELTSYVLVTFVEGAVRAYVYDEHILLKKLLPTCKSKASTFEKGHREMRLKEATEFLSRDTQSTIKKSIEAAFYSVVRATHSVLNPQRQQLAFELFQCQFLLTERLNVFLLSVVDNPSFEFASPKLANFHHQLLENALELVVDPVFRPPQNQFLTYQLNNFQLVFDSTLLH